MKGSSALMKVYFVLSKKSEKYETKKIPQLRYGHKKSASK